MGRRWRLACVAATATYLLGMPAAAGASGLPATALAKAALAKGTPAKGTPAKGAPAKGTPVCRVRDDRLTEISGMAAVDGGFVVVNDSADEEPRRRIFFLDAGCAVVRTVRYPSRPRDTEDLAVGPDGTIWVADIGDNDRTRETVAVWTLPPGGARPALRRMRYPDGPHDAEAVLLTGDGRPIIVTKEPSAAGLYAPATAPRAGATAPLTQLGRVDLPATTTSNPFSIFGRALITGGATAPDGRRVVLRTYSDAFEFDVPDGDVVAALTRGTPRIVPLPDEPQGESVTYSRDGRSLLTVSETADQPPGTRPEILRYPLPTPAAGRTGAAAPAGRDGAGARTPAARPGAAGAHRARPVLLAAGAIGLVGIGLLIAGLARARRNR
ncbi:hypothetical protein ACFFWC_09660 [Plantactinospora siamensis]|uniref:Esterase-like activity of phytase family protein n=1 Tax=Plantactinospora siamensis TaxID=555372 RepID=A0ABV6P6T6_9ACTN